ncbi:MAG: class GN sortase, partial [Gammaproteobacteria bacterium]
MLFKKSNKILLAALVSGSMGFMVAGQGVYMAAKASFAQYLMEQAWLESSRQGISISPWPWADTKPMARINFIKQKQSLIVMEGSSGRTLAFAPG